MKKQMGVLCHVTSVPSDYGVGDFGRSSFEFIDFLAENNLKVWQILPLNETNIYNCPYASTCYFSYEECLVDPEALLNAKLISEKDLKTLRKLAKTKKVKFDIVKKEKAKILEIAFGNLDKDAIAEVEAYIKKCPWVKEYAYFKTLLEKFGTSNWREVPKEYWHKKNDAYQTFMKENHLDILMHAYFQYLLHSQWQTVRKYAKSKGVTILGDLPIYPDPNSYDVFANPEAYKLDKQTLEPLVTGGVPSDEFCDEGQNWQTCVYDWEYLKTKNYKYMIDKFNLLLSKYDILRLDHFFGYTEHYEWNAKKPGKGKWVKQDGPGFFTIVNEKCNMKKFVIEDLGLKKVTANKVRKDFSLKGMCVVQMIMETKKNLQYLPQNVPEDCLYYLGTHDNSTFMGYLKKHISKKEKIEFCKHMGIEKKGDKYIHLECIRKMLASKANTVILQIQDLLLQGDKDRMNTPGQAAGWWEYRVPKNYKTKAKQTLTLVR